ESITFASDQYAIGLLVCQLLEGVLYGEEAHFIVPVGGKATERFRILRNGGVYLPPEFSPVDDAGRTAWQGFLSRCLRFAPEARYPSMADLAGEMRELLRRHPIAGDLQMRPSFGRLQVRDGDSLSWELEDIRA